MDTKSLKDKILQLAMQGKLVPQDENDEPASVLLERIKKEKEQLIKDKKIKKEKSLPEITEDEIPYELPNGWEWTRLNNICSLITDGTHSTPKYAETGIPFISVKDISNGKIDFSNTKFISIEEHENLIKRCNPQYEDILLTKIGTTGIAKVIDTKKDFSIFVSVALLKIFKTEINPMYLEYIINSPIVKKQSEENTQGVGNKNLVLKFIKNFIIPIPPLNEQKRIVKKIDSLFNLIDELENNKQDLLHNISNVRNKALQLAMRGKLVPQDENDEPASVLLERIKKEKEQLIKDKKLKKEKALPEITEDEIPYELPKGWEWVRFSNVLDIRDGTHDTPKYVKTGIPLITSKNINGKVIDFSNVKYISKEDHEKISLRSKVDNGDILFAMIGSIGNPVIVKKDIDFSIKNVALFKYYKTDSVLNKYLYYYLLLHQSYMKEIASGGVQSFVSLSFLRKYLFPLPPLNEQKRIVKKLDSIIKLCDELESELNN